MKNWLTEINARLHQDVPSKPIAVILSSEELESQPPFWTDLGPNGMNVTSMFDWIGFDCYPSSWNNCGVLGGMPAYVQKLRSWLWNNQRMIAVPDGWHPTSDPSYFVPLETQAAKIDLINKWHAEVISDGKYVAIVPFMWQSSRHS